MSSAALLLATLALTFITLLCSLWTIWKTLQPFGKQPNHTNRNLWMAIAPRLLPAQRLQLLLSTFDIALVIVYDASMAHSLFNSSSSPISPLSDGAPTFGLVLALVARPALIAVFACNSCSSIWLSRSLRSDWHVFVPPLAFSAIVASVCALLVHFLSKPTGNTIASRVQQILAGFLIVFLSLSAIINTLAFSGIIWAVWMSRPPQPSSLARQSSRVLAAPDSDRASVRETRKGLAEFGLEPNVSTNTFGQDRPRMATTSKNAIINRALNGTLGLSIQTGTTNESHLRRTYSAAASSNDVYQRAANSLSNSDKLTTRDHGRGDDLTQPSVPYMYDHDFDGTFTSEPSVLAAHHARVSSQPSQSHKASYSRTKSSIHFLDRSASSALVRNVVASGFVALDSAQVRIAVARQGIQLPPSPIEDEEKPPDTASSNSVASEAAQEAVALSQIETCKALVRLTGLIFSVWLPLVSEELPRPVHHP